MSDVREDGLEEQQARDASTMVLLCNVADDIESNLVLGLLRSEGIEAISSTGMDPAILPLGTSNAGSILVVESDLEAAQRILADHRLSTFAVAVILAGGQGTRMGQAKGLLQLGSKTILEELLEAYSASLVREVVVVVRPDSPLIGTIDSNLATVVANQNPDDGPLSSIWAALDEVGESADALLVHPVDVPAFDVELIDELVRRYERGEGPILVPTHAARRGHPVLFGKAVFPKLREAPLDQGARHVLHEYPDSVVEVPTESSCVTIDLNTPEELEAFLRTYPKGSPERE